MATPGAPWRCCSRVRTWTRGWWRRTSASAWWLSDPTRTPSSWMSRPCPAPGPLAPPGGSRLCAGSQMRSGVLLKRPPGAAPSAGLMMARARCWPPPTVPSQTRSATSRATVTGTGSPGRAWWQRAPTATSLTPRFWKCFRRRQRMTTTRSSAPNARSWRTPWCAACAGSLASRWTTCASRRTSPRGPAAPPGCWTGTSGRRPCRGACADWL
mmetsp:Transcript_863/g.3346  ORF Transcript_863/g.3346 Transcript_863/m.3346 type:complete len:212 (+) Transcript_863:769-1404(+)